MFMFAIFMLYGSAKAYCIYETSLYMYNTGAWLVHVFVYKDIFPSVQ